MEITPQLVEQVRRWLTRTIYEFHHTSMASLSGEAFEQWHEDKAKELLTFIGMSDADRAIATKELHVSSSNPRRTGVPQ